MYKVFGDKKLLVRKLLVKDLKHPKWFCDFVNALVAQDAKILANKAKTEQEELAWVKFELLKMKQKRGVRLVVEYQEQIVGSCHISLRRERESHIGEFGIAISEGFRGIGLGSFLIKNIVSLAKKELVGLKIVELGVFDNNKTAQHVYRKAGFSEVCVIPNRVQFQDQLIAERIMHLYL